MAEAEETRRLQLELWERAAKGAAGAGGANGSATAVTAMDRSPSGQ